MPLNFPDNPQLNDTFTVNGRTYTYNGRRWRRTKARLAEVAPTLDIANDFTAGGALHVDSGTGRVGIGTANPQYELHVDGVGEVTGDFQVGQNLDVTGTVDINGLRLTSDGSSISLSEVLAGTYSTQAATTNDDTLATTAFVQSAIANLVDSAPGTLNTLNELAAALDDDPNFATTVTNNIALKLDSSSYTAADVLAKIKTVDGAGSSLDADLFDGQDSAEFTRYAGSLTTQDWNTLVNGTESSYYNVVNANGSNRPSAYMYGALVSWSTASGSKFQLYSPHNGVSGNGLWWRSGWNTDYDSWVEVWTSGTDGSGSGLDADLLDGNHASAFAASVHTHSYLSTSGGTVSGDLAVTGRFQIGGHYIDDVAGSGNPYGSINVGGAMTWDGYAIDNRVVFMHDGGSYAGLYNDVNNHWMVYCTLNGGVELRYQDSNKLYVDASGSVTNGRHYASSVIHANSYLRSDNGIGNILISGTDQDGAVYFAGSNSTGSTAAIEASWNNSLRPQIAIGVTRDSNNTKALFTYHGWGALYANNAERFYWDTGGFRLTGTQYASSTRELKENIRNADSDPNGVTSDAATAFSKWNTIQTVVFDWKEKPTDPIWVGCQNHESRFDCELSDCDNARTEQMEHVCGQGWCYGTLEDPCPRYTGVRNVLGWIAEDIRDIYGDRMVGYSEDRVLQSINMTAFHAEHVKVTQHLISYIEELESRIEALEAN